jgi:hypothetical protein
MARFLIKDVSGRIEGPISSSELRRWVQSGRITRETMIQQEGRRSWHRAADVPAIAALLPPREEPEELGAEAPRSQDPAPIVYDFSDTPSDPTPAAGQPIEPGEAREYEVADSEEPQAQRPIHRPEAMSFQHAGDHHAEPTPRKRNEGQPRGFSDRILRATFQFARSISVLVIIVSLLVITASIALGTYAMLPAPPRFERPIEQPTMDQFLTACKPPEDSPRPPQRSPRGRSNGLDAPDRCAPYRPQVEEAVAKLQLEPTRSTEALCSRVLEIDAEFRGQFLEGLLQLADKHAAKQPADPSCNGAAAANWYISEFNDRISQLKQDRMDAAAELARRRSLIGPAIQGVGAAIAALLLFLILPLLIQIERNTRAGSA